MNIFLRAFACIAALTVALPLFGTKVGDSYESVIAARGEPSMKVERDGLMILKYNDEILKLRENKVIAIEGASKEATTPRTVGIGDWTTDYTAALAQAKADQRLTFVFFTGSDWCGWCQRLDREILSTPAFRNFAREKLVLVKLDFPSNRPQSPTLKAQNEKLAGHYDVDGFPTIIVLNSKGKKVKTLGYQEGGPGPFIKALKNL